MRSLVILCMMLTTCATVAAQPRLDPDEEVARRRYADGVKAYDRGDYEAALAAFEAARQAKPLPDFEFNIGRCHDRLGHWKEAADAYGRYVAAKPDAADAAEVQQRIAQLRERIASTPPPPPAAPVAATAAPPPPPPPRHHLRLAAWVVGGAALALAGAGAGAYFSVYSDYSARKTACNGTCDPATTRGLQSRVDTAVGAGAALWALAGAAAVVDVVLWTLDARHRGERRVAWTPSSLAVSF